MDTKFEELVEMLGGKKSETSENDKARLLAIILMFATLPKEFLEGLSFSTLGSLRDEAPEEHKILSWTWSRMLLIGTFDHWFGYWKKLELKHPDKRPALDQTKKLGTFSQWSKIWKDHGDLHIERVSLKAMCESAVVFSDYLELFKFSFKSNDRFFGGFFSRRSKAPSRKEVRKHAWEGMVLKGVFEDWLSVYKESQIDSDWIHLAGEQLSKCAGGQNPQQWAQMYEVAKVPNLKQQAYQKLLELTRSHLTV